MESPQAVLNGYVRDKGIRQSEQRAKVLDVFLKTERHLSVAEIYELVRKKYSTIGYATVYRAMKVICEAGLAREVDFGDGASRYEHKYGHEHHDHMICLKCGKFIEVMSPAIEKLQEKMAQGHGFTPVRHKMQIFGICKKCKVKGTKG